MRLIMRSGVLPLLAAIYTTAQAQLIEKQAPSVFGVSENSLLEDDQINAVDATASAAAITGGGE